MATCPICGRSFIPRTSGGHPQKECSPECRRKHSYALAEARRKASRPKPTDDDETQQRPACVKNTELHAKFIYSPAEDGWPAGCSFPLTEIKETLHLGYFPAGSKFQTKARKIFTVCGKVAIAADGERIA